MTTDRPVIGISLMLGFCIVAPFGDAVAKLLGASVPLAQVVLIRFAVQLIILAPLVWLSRRPLRIRGLVLWLTILRTLLHIAGIAAMFTALKYLPLADAVAIVFVMPFFMLILGKYVLSEEVGGRRLLACVAGFGGTLLIVQPSFSEVGWPAILPIFVAANFSVFILITRRIAKHTDPISLQAVSGAMAVALMIPADTDQWFLLLAIGILGSLAHLLMTWSLRYAPAATLAPMQYLEIPIATLIGLVIFNELPDGWAMVGIGVTMAAGVYILIREGAIQRRLDAIKPQQPAYPFLYGLVRLPDLRFQFARAD